jgi:hypothetical protein
VIALRVCTPLILSQSKDESFCSWFDKLTMSDTESDLLAKLKGV